MSYVLQPFSLKLVMTFKDSSTYTIDTNNKKITSFKLNEEESKDITNPIGVISANEIDIQLKNDDGEFTITNSTSSIYGKMGRDVKLDISFTENGVDYENIGTFYVTKWDNEVTPTGKTYAKIHAVDRLQALMNLPMPAVQVNTDITLYDYTELVFQSLGLTTADYDIDITLTQILELSILDGDKVSDILNNIATAGFCYINVGRDGKIYVIDRRNEEVSVFDLTGSTNVVSVAVGPKLTNSYSVVRVNYGRVALSDSVLFLDLKQLNCPTGVKSFNNIKLDKTNMVSIDYIRATSTLGDILVYNVTATQDTVSFDINNTGVSDVLVDIKIYGRSVEVTDTFEELIDQPTYDKIGERVLEVENRLLQTEVYAEELAQRIFDYLIKEIPYIELKLKNVGLSLKTGDYVTVQSSKFDVNYLCRVHSIIANYTAAGLKMTAKTTVLSEVV